MYVNKTASEDYNVRIGGIYDYYFEGPCISIQIYATINELEHTHAAAAHQKYAVWWGDR